jgi:hypothetical protein
MNQHRAPIDREAAKALAAQRHNERRMRVRRIRNGGIAAAAATFVLAWGIVFGQVASGHDPALTKSSSTSTVNDSTTSSSDDTYSTSSVDPGQQSSPSAPSPVTTSQS